MNDTHDNRPVGPASEALSSLMARDNLIDSVRMDRRWDEQEFYELVEVSVRCLEDLADAAFIPRHVAAFFGYRLHMLEAMIRHPEFIAQNRGERTQEQAEQFFARRREILQKLTSWMARGGHPYPPEHFEPGE